MHRCKQFAITLGLLAAPLARASAQGAPAPGMLLLTRRQAVDSALANNPQLRVATTQIAQARARVTEATAFPDPTLSADYGGLTSPTAFGSNTGSDVGVGLTVPFLTKFRLRDIVSSADLHSAQFNLVQLQQQTASQTVQAYDALLVAERHHADLLQTDSLAADFFHKTQVRYQNGAAARLDVIKAQVDLSQVENDLIANERERANARAGLNRLMGRMLGSAIDAADSLAVPADLPQLDALTLAAHDARPELRAAAGQRRGASASTSLAREFWLPDLSLGVTKNTAQGTASSYTTGIGFTVPLFFWNHSRGEVAEARWHERELEASYRDLEAQVDLDVRTTYATASTALRQAAFLRDQVLPEAREAYRIASVSYGLGGSSALDVLDARRTLVDAQNQFAEALGAANDARADLERAVGTPLDAPALGGSHDR
ncbi:MAG TPA: TolC family protein [Gemmatimonadales bacterium]|jgi:cobalt-zinc-cadmium efflux system outer membrane protein